MKYSILIGDGMADDPIEELGNKTPLEYANTPNMDYLASCGSFGLFKSVPDGYPPGSDVAIMSILGFDPRKYYTGRAPFEAASIGVELKEDDIAYRCNLVTLSEKSGSFAMKDYSAGHISTEEAKLIIAVLDKELSKEGVKFYPGKSYRHLMVTAGDDKIKTIPPHDITDKEIKGYLPQGVDSEKLISLMERSREILKNHPVNKKRRDSGKLTADSIWLWGQGRKPKLPTFKETFNINGGIISAVDLLNGLGIYAGLQVIKVPGITGYLDTDYDAKARYALNALVSKDFVCVHVEAPDEAGHQGLLKEKIRAIEDFDKLIVGAMLDGIKKFRHYRIMVISDHPTPVLLKTHTRNPVPFAIFSGEDKPKDFSFNEKSAKTSGVFKEDPFTFMKEFFERR